MTAPTARRAASWERARTVARRALAVAALAGCVLLLRRTVDLPALAGGLAAAEYRLVALMALAHLGLFLGLKAVRWRLLLSPVRRVRLGTLYAVLLAGCAVTNLLPARAGQAVRVVLLRGEVPVAAGAAALVLEEVLNAAVLGLVALPVPFLVPLPASAQRALVLVGGGAAVALVLLAWAARAGGRRAEGLLRRLAAGLGVLREPRRAAAALGLTVALWLVDLGQIALAMKSVGLAPSYAGCALVLLFVNLTNAFPVTPGQLGLFEAAAAAACVAVGATPAQGVAVGVLYHAMQLVPETALGLAVLGRRMLGPGWREVTARLRVDEAGG